MQNIIAAWEYAQPILQDKIAYAHQYAATYIAPYLPDSLTPVVVKTSVGGALGGQLVTLLAGSAGNKISLPMSLALAYGGAQMMNAESNSILWLTTGLYATPTALKIAEKVAVQVISGGILKTAEVAVYGTFFAVTLPARAVVWAFSSSPEADTKKEFDTLKIKVGLLTSQVEEKAKKIDKLKAKLKASKEVKVATAEKTPEPATTNPATTNPALCKNIESE